MHESMLSPGGGGGSCKGWGGFDFSKKTVQKPNPGAENLDQMVASYPSLGCQDPKMH